MKRTWKSFVFEGFEWDAVEQVLKLRYSFDGEVKFEEVWSFDFEMASGVDSDVLDRAFEGLWLAAGVSYFKAALPESIVFRDGGISENQASFFEKVWKNGLGEFFYENRIDPKGVIEFKGDSGLESKSDINNHLGLRGALLPIGGGKDSMTSAIVLREGGVEFETWTVGDSKVQSACCHALGVPRVKVSRKICPELLQLNKEGALNGHVPISSILAFAGVASALLCGKKYVVLSNESSANEANTEWKGMAINHQWSKSLDFEREFQKYINENVTSEVNYFSLLRPWSELRIAEVFAKKGWQEFGKIFSSCNRNFHLGGSVIANRWCGSCPKCVFVSLILAPWLGKNEIESALGSVPFAEEQNEKLMAELLGLEGIKPLECVGTIAEAREAVVLGAERHECLRAWAEKFEMPKMTFGELHEHNLPDDFEKILKSII